MQTDVTKQDFEKSLEESGYNKTVAKDGKKYVTRETSKSHDGPSAYYTKSGSKQIDLKIRLKKGENG